MNLQEVKESDEIEFDFEGIDHHRWDTDSTWHGVTGGVASVETADISLAEIVIITFVVDDVLYTLSGIDGVEESPILETVHERNVPEGCNKTIGPVPKECMKVVGES